MPLSLDTNTRTPGLLPADAARVSASRPQARGASSSISGSVEQSILDAESSKALFPSSLPAPRWSSDALRGAALSVAQSFAGAWRDQSKSKADSIAANLAKLIEAAPTVPSEEKSAPWRAGDIRVDRRRDRLMGAVNEKLSLGRAHVDNQVLKVASAVSAAPKLASAGATISNAILPALGLSAAHPALFAGQVLGSTAAVVWLAVEGKGLAQSVWARRSGKNAFPSSETERLGAKINSSVSADALTVTAMAQDSEIDGLREVSGLSGLSGLKRRLVAARSSPDDAAADALRSSRPILR